MEAFSDQLKFYRRRHRQQQPHGAAEDPLHDPEHTALVGGTGRGNGNGGGGGLRFNPQSYDDDDDNAVRELLGLPSAANAATTSRVSSHSFGDFNDSEHEQGEYESDDQDRETAATQAFLSRRQRELNRQHYALPPEAQQRPQKRRRIDAGGTMDQRPQKRRRVDAGGILVQPSPPPPPAPPLPGLVEQQPQTMEIDPLPAPMAMAPPAAAEEDEGEMVPTRRRRSQGARAGAGTRAASARLREDGPGMDDGGDVTEDGLIPAELSEDEMAYERFGTMIGLDAQEDTEVCFGCDYLGGQLLSGRGGGGGGIKATHLDRFIQKLRGDRSANYQLKYYEELAREYEVTIRIPYNRRLTRGQTPLPPFTATQIYIHMHKHIANDYQRMNDELIGLHFGVIRNVRVNSLCRADTRERRCDGRFVKYITKDGYRIINESSKIIRTLMRDSLYYASLAAAGGGGGSIANGPIYAPPPTYTISRVAFQRQGIRGTAPSSSTASTGTTSSSAAS